MVTNDIVLVLISIILILLLCIKAYKTFLQRIFIYIVMAAIVNYLNGSILCFHKALNKKSEKACEFLAFLVLWSAWCFYTFIIVMIVYLLVLICTKIYRIKENAPQASKISILEVVIVLGTITVSNLVVCMPYYKNVDLHYGFNGFMCASIASNFTESYVIYILTAPSYIAGGIAVVVALGMTVVYCTLSAKLQQARIAIRNLIIFVCTVIIYSLAFRIQDEILSIISINYCRRFGIYIATILLSSAMVVTLFIGYLLTFQFPKFCDPLKNLVKKKIRNHRHNLNYNYNNEYGTFRKSSRETAPSTTYFNISYTGDFTNN